MPIMKENKLSVTFGKNHHYKYKEYIITNNWPRYSEGNSLGLEVTKYSKVNNLPVEGKLLGSLIKEHLTRIGANQALKCFEFSFL